MMESYARPRNSAARRRARPRDEWRLRGEPTQLVVLVDSDMNVPSELATVNVVVSDASGREVTSRPFALAEVSSAGSAQYALPLSFGVVPQGGDVSRRVDVVVSGLGPDDTTLVSRRARTGFVEGQTSLLRMFLARSCRGVVCGGNQTCTETGCVSYDVPPMSLPSIEPGQELDGGRRDSGIPPNDGGRDGDAGGDDGGGDGGRPPLRFTETVGSATCDGDLSIRTSDIATGTVLVVSVAQRGGSGGAVEVTDTRGNAYVAQIALTAADPHVAVFTTIVTTALRSGDTITITPPGGSSTSAIVDQIAADLVPSSIGASDRSMRSSAVLATLDSAAPSMVHATAVIQNRRDFSLTTAGYVSAGEVSASCGGVPGTMTHLTFTRFAPAGTTAFEGTFDASDDWTVGLVGLAAE